MEQLGDYTIQKKIGDGVLGAVYLAEHRFIKKLFALKTLPSEVCSHSNFMRRFEAEVSQIASLDHPNILKIHNVSFADGLYFLVTDPEVDSFEEPMHLGRYIEQKGKSLEENEWTDLLMQIASALDYAHEMGIMHGGLKPSNVLVTPTERGVKLLLTDFGLTRLIGQRFVLSRICNEIARGDSFQSFVTAYAFLAPEQKREKEVSFKADAWSFGVLAYYLLSHGLPEGCFDLPSSWLESSAQNWDLLINRCLQVNPNVRPQKLVQAMQEYLFAPRSLLKEMLHIAEEKSEGKHESTLQMDFELEQEAPQEALKPVLKPQEIVRPEYEPDPGAIFQRETHVSHYTPCKTEEREIEPLLTEMVVIPGGVYLRGSAEGARDEMPRHQIKLFSFAMDVHPVTNEQFIRFLQAMGGEKDHNNNDIIRLRDSRIKRSAGKLVIESGYAKHPVVGVTWYGATAYAKWIGKKLPTEAQWEMAASGGKEMLYPTGSDIERSSANFFSADTTAVMSYPPNPFGLFDMAGNVYEWCQDWYAYNYYEASALEPDNPQGPLQGVYRVLRGGCWKSLKEDLRVSHRHRNNPGAVNGTYGFRCAAEVL